MSLLQAIQEEQKASGRLIVIGGKRLDGKTTLCGTLPGKTLLLYHKTLETGYKAAMKLAKKNGNDLTKAGFSTLEELVEHLQEGVTMDFDHIYIDGCSSVAELKLKTLKANKKPKESIWDLYAELGQTMTNLLLLMKQQADITGINMFITLAYKTNNDGSLEADLHGNVTMASIKKLCPTVMAVTNTFDEDGKMERILITKSNAEYPARVDGFLDDENPGQFPANLETVLKFFEDSET
jgi:hypothetical protein